MTKLTPDSGPRDLYDEAYESKLTLDSGSSHEIHMTKLTPDSGSRDLYDEACEALSSRVEAYARFRIKSRHLYDESSPDSGSRDLYDEAGEARSLRLNQDREISPVQLLDMGNGRLLVRMTLNVSCAERRHGDESTNELEVSLRREFESNRDLTSASYLASEFNVQRRLRDSDSQGGRDSESQRLRESEIQRVRGSETHSVRDSETQIVRGSESQRLRGSAAQRLIESETHRVRFRDSENQRVRE
ncbi:uncharacterized protein [Macrobrachium rosenbergii]|uniref:uncharacterized protein n=1 Tax=Macrobrachium rosenbergii TaxID=79674 RepID=UPI0034D50264